MRFFGLRFLKISDCRSFCVFNILACRIDTAKINRSHSYSDKKNMNTEINLKTIVVARNATFWRTKEDTSQWVHFTVFSSRSFHFPQNLPSSSSKQMSSLYGLETRFSELEPPNSILAIIEEPDSSFESRLLP